MVGKKMICDAEGVIDRRFKRIYGEWGVLHLLQTGNESTLQRWLSSLIGARDIGKLEGFISMLPLFCKEESVSIKRIIKIMKVKFDVFTNEEYGKFRLWNENLLEMIKLKREVDQLNCIFLFR
jgi:hypothetical protein